MTRLPHRNGMTTTPVCEFAKFAIFRRVWSSLPSLHHIWVVVLMPLLAIPLLALQAAPARAQGVFVTPTPYPAIVATQNAAQQRSDAARANQAQAAQLEAQAAELRRNAEAQQSAAQQAINDTRAAAAAQNAAAVGEAIGRAESSLNQLRDTVNAQAAIVEELKAGNTAQAQAIISMTLELQQARADKQTMLSNYTATAQQLEDAQKQGQSTPVVTYVFIILFVCTLAVLLIVVLQRKGQPAKVVSSRNDNDVVEGEFTNGTSQNDPL